MKVLLSITAVLILGQLVFAQRVDPPPTTPCPVYDCAIGDPVFNCLINPCNVSSCEAYADDSMCCPNYCGGCFAEWFRRSNGDPLSADQCSFSADCPLSTSSPDRTSIDTTCQFPCRGDDDCSDSQVCCSSNGCGSVCQDPIDRCSLLGCPVPLCLPGYTPETPEGECCPVCRPVTTMTCPDPTISLLSGSVLSTTCPGDCDENNTCSSDRMCCENDRCGDVCQVPVPGCAKEDGDVVIRAGETFRKDRCTLCVCLRNGTIACNQTCNRECPDASSIDAPIGICANLCSDTEPCPQEGDYCCENSCGGMVCVSPKVTCRTEDGEVLEPGATFTDDCNTCTCQDDGTVTCTEVFCPEYGCPPVRDDTIPTDFSCAFDLSCGVNGCPDDQLCCPVYTGCAPACVSPVIVCELENDTVLNVGDTFTPKRSCGECTCGDNGQIVCEEIECPGCTTDDGEFYRVGSRIPSGDCNTCTCDEVVGADPDIVCTDRDCGDYCDGPNGAQIAVGGSFEADDGCNTCSCTANGVICTLIFCGDRCYQPQQVGDCDGVNPRYWFDHTTGVCSLFNYGGCGGNRNRFETLRECLQVCNRNSTCLSTVYPNDEEPRCLIASQQRWTFNLDTGICERIGYIPCQSSDRYNVYNSLEDCSRRCVNGTIPVSECPPDVPIAFCLANPCQVNSCPNFPEAKCEANFCGGCNAVFYDSDGDDITDRCITTPTCADGTPIVRCFANPCEVNRCPNYPEATCMANFCGGCNAWYFDDERNNVTDECHTTGTGRPTPLEYLQCPALVDGTIATCDEQCRNDEDCVGSQLCCSNGCGHSCQMGETIPYYPIPLQCPEVSDDDFIGLCVITDNSCIFNDQCEDDQLCCRRGCGRECTSAERSSEPCFAIVDSIYAAVNASDVLGVSVGAYTPQCLDDGTFAPVQFHASTGYSWCVHTQTGEPLSSRAGRGERPNCITCMYSNQTHYPGQSFPHTDGCNKCFCNENGGVSCTRIACGPTGCDADPEPGPCRGSFPAYYFDSEEGTCKSFIYGGCGGNDNKFMSVRDCLRKCDRENECLLRPDSGPCEALFPSYFYNTSSGQCEQFAYGGCQGNGNRFERGEECVDTCDPDGEYVEGCVGIACSIPICPPGSELVNDDSSCCPYCSEPELVECDDDEKRCRDGTQCVSIDRICDVLEDCDDGSDERDCPEPPDTCSTGFLCGTQECIPRSYVCDDYVDCRDRSDERDCSDLPSNTRYIPDIPRECPPVNDRLADCEDEPCRRNEDCDSDDELCCPTSCGQSMCVDGDAVTPRCPALRRSFLFVNTTIFVPDCERDGTFSPRQCYRDYCWCVDIQTGYPISEGVRGMPTCSGCQLNPDDPNSVIPFGETYPDRDGCNLCYCTREYPEERCTNDRCPVSCEIDGVRIAHGDSYEDVCIACKCDYGSLSCTRRPCVSVAPIRQPTRVTMPFDGDFDAIITDDNKRDELKREVMRTFITKYGDSLNLKQDQIEDVDLRKGSVIVIVTLTDSDNTSNANITVLLNQLQQDYMTGNIVIRYDNQVLQPSGDIGVEEQTASPVLQTWHIIVIVVAAVAIIVAIVAIIIAVVACCRPRNRGSPKYSGTANPANEYAVSFNKGGDDVKVPLD